jgi:hypothetical protein
MAIIMTVTPKGLYLESAIKNDSNFKWDDYLEFTPIPIDNDQILVHSELELLWINWLTTNFDPEIATIIDKAADEVAYQTPWSLESGISGALPISKEIEQLISEKLPLLADNEYILLSIVA